jgi:heme-degrading monooxygenase HmoA
MNAPFETLAENLEPPFVAAIIGDTAIVEHLTECERRPSDEMVSLAPAQAGFLGLETTRDDKGRWISVSYWRDMAAFNYWRDTCAAKMTELFPEAPLESLCHIRVANVEEPVQPQRARHLKADEPVPTSHVAHEGRQRMVSEGRKRLTNIFPSIAGLLGHVHAR